MKVHPLIAGIVLTAILGLECWMAKEISELKVHAATLATELHMHMQQTTKTIAQK